MFSLLLFEYQFIILQKQNLKFQLDHVHEFIAYHLLTKKCVAQQTT